MTNCKCAINDALHVGRPVSCLYCVRLPISLSSRATETFLLITCPQYFVHPPPSARRRPARGGPGHGGHLSRDRRPEYRRGGEVHPGGPRVYAPLQHLRGVQRGPVLLRSQEVRGATGSVFLGRERKRLSPQLARPLRLPPGLDVKDTLRLRCEEKARLSIDCIDEEGSRIHGCRSY